MLAVNRLVFYRREGYFAFDTAIAADSVVGWKLVELFEEMIVF